MNPIIKEVRRILGADNVSEGMENFLLHIESLAFQLQANTEKDGRGIQSTQLTALAIAVYQQLIKGGIK